MLKVVVLIRLIRIILNPSVKKVTKRGELEAYTETNLYEFEILL